MKFSISEPTRLKLQRVEYWLDYFVYKAGWIIIVFALVGAIQLQTLKQTGQLNTVTCPSIHNCDPGKVIVGFLIDSAPYLVLVYALAFMTKYLLFGYKQARKKKNAT